MAFTYDITTDRGKVRARIGDTEDHTGQGTSLDDDEVDAALDLSDDLDVAALWACRWYLAKLARWVNSNQKGVSAQLGQRFAQTKEILAELKEVVRDGEIEPHFEGLSKADNDVHDQDSDFIGAEISVGMDDYRGGGSWGNEDDV